MMTIHVTDADVLSLRRPSYTASTPVTDRDDHTKRQTSDNCHHNVAEVNTCSTSSETVERCCSDYGGVRVVEQ